MLRLTDGPFRYQTYADRYLEVALRYAHRPVKQAVISPSALSLMYPPEPIPGYSREQFIADLLREHETEVRDCLRKGAHGVQIDFTEGRLAVKLDPSGELLHRFIDLNNLALARFSAEDRRRIGVHPVRAATSIRRTVPMWTIRRCFPASLSSWLVPSSSRWLEKGSCPRPPNRPRSSQARSDGLRRRGRSDRPTRREQPEEVCERVLQALEYVPLAQLGTCDDCGFAPFCDDTTTTRETAFAKIRARVEGTAMASAQLQAR